LEFNIPDFFNHSSKEMLLWRQKYNWDKAWRSLYEILYKLLGVTHEQLCYVRMTGLTFNTASVLKNALKNTFYIFRQQGNLLHFKTRCLIYLFSTKCCFIILSFSVQIIVTFVINSAIKYKYPPRSVKGYLLVTSNKTQFQ
jgi:hypothetical protein